jgi:competence protein ComEC
LVEPMVYFITVLGLLAALVGGVSPIVAWPLLELAKLPATWIVYVANTLATAPFGLLEVPGGVVGVVLAVVFVITLTWAIKRNTSKVLPWGLLVCWALYLAASLIQQISFSSKPWQVVACDVGQGDALLLRSEGQIALVDVGKDPKLINDCLNQMGVNRINLLVISHFDHDHVGGLSGALQGRTVDSAMVSAFPDTRPQAQQMLETLQNSTEQLIIGNLNLTGTLGAFEWRVISSLGEFGTSANEASLGVTFSSSDISVVTLGDLNERAQEMIVAYVHDSDKPTVVKVSHHGSADQSAEFYERIGADVALISVGESNSYGHPTSSALKMLEKSGSRVFRTDKDGAIALQVIGGAIEVVTARAG